MSRRLPRVRKVLSYSKGHGGDLERAMDALGPSADSPEELRRIFILGVTAHLAGYSTHRDGRGEHHLIRFMDQHPAARLLAQEILGVSGGYPLPADDGFLHRPAAQKVPATEFALDQGGRPPKEEATLAAAGAAPRQKGETTSTDAVLGSNATRPAGEMTGQERSTTSQETRPSTDAAKRTTNAAEAELSVATDVQRPAESAQFGAVSSGETPEGPKNLSNAPVVQKKVDGNQPEISTEKTVSNMTIGDAELTVDASTGTVNAVTDVANGEMGGEASDDAARQAAIGLIVRAMNDF